MQPANREFVDGAVSFLEDHDVVSIAIPVADFEPALRRQLLAEVVSGDGWDGIVLRGNGKGVLLFAGSARQADLAAVAGQV